MEQLLDAMRRPVKAGMERLAAGLNRLSGGKLSPDFITLSGFAAHVPIAYLIAIGRHGLAALLLAVFGLFDALDGALARLQRRDSARGMLLDASTDRMKEVLLCSGAAYFLAGGQQPRQAVLAAAALGASLCVSYVKAKGEAAIAGRNLPHTVANRMFQDGLMRFEVRMAALIAGLLFGVLTPVLAGITVLAAYTAAQRLIVVSKKLSEPETLVTPQGPRDKTQKERHRGTA